VKLNDLAPATLALIAHLLKSPSNPQGADPEAELPKPTGYHVLALQYVRPEKSSGGIIFSGATLREDSLQGRVGIVLALGPDAYTDTAKFPSGEWCKVGDVIAWPPLENVSGRYPFGGAVLCAMTDDRVVFTGVDVSKMVGR
jgi:hypothetical protein